VALRISQKVRLKLSGKTPPVAEEEIEQCFANRSGIYLEDSREAHKSDPPTKWFIAETDRGRKLKVVFIQRGDDTFIRTAYSPNRQELRIYEKYSAQS
jgi:hypothetical protein